MGTAKKNAVATVEEKPLAVAGAYDYGSDAGAGFEGIKSSDLSIPFLNVMQANSPTVAEGVHKNGDIVNSVTGDVYPGDKGVPFRPVEVIHKFVKWKPRDQGGGMLGQFDPEDPYVRETKKLNGDAFGKLKTSDGNELIETHYVYGHVLDDAGINVESFAVLAMTSTKITPFKKWQTAMWSMRGKPPLFAFRARMFTTNEKNDKGQPYKGVLFKPLVGESWAGCLIPPNTPEGRALLDAGKELREMVMSGAAKAAYDTQDTSGDPAAGGKSSKADGEVPF